MVESYEEPKYKQPYEMPRYLEAQLMLAFSDGNVNEIVRLNKKWYAKKMPKG